MINDFSEWLIKEDKNKQTIREYSVILQKLVEWFFRTEGEEFFPDKITTLHIYEFISYLDKIKEYEPAYINKIIACLKTFFHYAIETQIVTYNPMLKVKMKRTMKQYTAPKWLNKQELSKFFHEIEKEKNEEQKIRNLAICRLMAGAGLRVQEVSELNISDLCLEKRKENITVRNGKGNKYRIVPLNGDVIESLKNWLQFRKNITVDSLEPIFLSERLSRISDRAIRYMVSKYAENAKILDVSPHTLRHTFCKNLSDQGFGLQIIAQLAGHDSLETTRRYTQPGDNDLRKAVQTISDSR